VKTRAYSDGPAADSANRTLRIALDAQLRLLAPFLPFATEELWQNLVARPFGDSQPESVHLADYPEPDAAAIDEPLSREMRAVREIVSLGLQVRTANKLRVRQPLAAAEVVLSDPELAPRVLAHEGLVKDELNVHELHIASDAGAYVTYQVKPNFRALGPRVGKRMPAAKAAVAAGKQGKFFEMHDKLFENQRTLSPDLYEKTAKELGLDVDKFKKDMESPETAQMIQQEMADAGKVDVRGTPTFFINGKKPQGRSFELYKQIIDEQIKAKKG